MNKKKKKLSVILTRENLYDRIVNFPINLILNAVAYCDTV